jgi:uncharacterized protein YjbI with pentapeptide repeats
VPAELASLVADAALRSDEPSWSGVALEDAQLGELERTGLSIVSSRLERVDLAAFTSATLERVTFEGCRMAQCDLQDSACESVRFLSCDLSECDLTDARFKRSELRGCELGGLHGVDRLRGAGIEWGDLLELAPALAATLGIRLLDPVASA